jgi:hypothetical protein
VFERESRPYLQFWVSGIQLQCNFFDEDEIELYFAPEEVTSESRLEAVLAFLVSLAKSLHRSVTVSPEGASEFPVLMVEPAGAITYSDS